MIDALMAQSELTVSSKDKQTDKNVLIQQVLPSPNIRLIHLEIKVNSQNAVGVKGAQPGQTN